MYDYIDVNCKNYIGLNDVLLAPSCVEWHITVAAVCLFMLKLVRGQRLYKVFREGTDVLASLVCARQISKLLYFFPDNVDEICHVYADVVATRGIAKWRARRVPSCEFVIYRGRDLSCRYTTMRFTLPHIDDVMSV